MVVKLFNAGLRGRDWRFISNWYQELESVVKWDGALWFKQYFIHRKYIHVSTIQNGTGSDSKQSAYM